MPGGDYRDALRDRAGWVPEAGPAPRRRRRAGGGAPRDARLHGRPAPGPRRRARDAALRQSRIDPLTNTITLGRREDLETTTVDARAGDLRRRRRAERPVAVPCRDPDPPSRHAHRGHGPSGDASEPARGGRWVAELDSPVWAAAPGQAAVLYDGEVVLGGGRMARPAVAPALRRHRPRDRRPGPVPVAAGSASRRGGRA